MGHCLRKKKKLSLRWVSSCAVERPSLDHSCRILSSHLLYLWHAWWRSVSQGEEVVPGILTWPSGIPAGDSRSPPIRASTLQGSYAESLNAQTDALSKCCFTFRFKSSISFFRKWVPEECLSIGAVCINCLLWNHCCDFAKISPIVHCHYFLEGPRRKLSERIYLTPIWRQVENAFLALQRIWGRILCSG